MSRTVVTTEETDAQGRQVLVIHGEVDTSADARKAVRSGQFGDGTYSILSKVEAGIIVKTEQITKAKVTPGQTFVTRTPRASKADSGKGNGKGKGK